MCFGETSEDLHRGFHVPLRGGTDRCRRPLFARESKEDFGRRGKSFERAEIVGGQGTGEGQAIHGAVERALVAMLTELDLRTHAFADDLRLAIGHLVHDRLRVAQQRVSLVPTAGNGEGCGCAVVAPGLGR